LLQADILEFRTAETHCNLGVSRVNYNINKIPRAELNKLYCVLNTTSLGENVIYVGEGMEF